MQTATRYIATPLTISLIALGVYQILALLFPVVNHAQFYSFLFFYFAQEVFAGYLLHKVQQDRDKFITVFFALTAARFLLAMIGSLVIMMMFPAKKDLLGMSFCVLYLYYLATDTFIVGSNLKKRQESETR